jgi:hypothetical protein
MPDLFAGKGQRELARLSQATKNVGILVIPCEHDGDQVSDFHGVYLLL